MSRFIDLTGNVYGHLTVVRRGEDLVKKNGKHEVRWLCRCDCGNPNEVLALGYNLKNSNTQSCGCLHRHNGHVQGKKYGAVQGKRNKKYNTYDLTGDYGIGFTLKGEEFYFDLEDYDLIKDYCWHKNRNGYIINKSAHNTVWMHRVVMGVSDSDDIIVDHIYHQLHDNRKSKLRVVTSSQNNMNRRIASNNKSGVTGVWYDIRTGKWAAEIGFDKKKIYLGEFLKMDDAIDVRRAAEKQYFGEYIL